MRIALLLALVLMLAGCGGRATPKRVPDVRGQRLDLAEDRLSARGLDWEEIGGGNLGIIVRSNWYVCSQVPRPGRRATTVRLLVERECAETIEPAPVVPDVTGESLEDADDAMEARGIEWTAETGEGDEPLVKHLWQVCSQDPAAGTRARFVELYVDRICD